jgi:hypothetical protein
MGLSLDAVSERIQGFKLARMPIAFKRGFNFIDRIRQIFSRHFDVLIIYYLIFNTRIVANQIPRIVEFSPFFVS